MMFADLVPALHATIFVTSPKQGNRPVLHVIASDLMSDVLVAHMDDFVLVTSLASDQMIRTADLVDAAGVVLVNGKTPPPSLIQLARDLDIPLLGTALTKFETCLVIGNTLKAGTPS